MATKHHRSTRIPAARILAELYPIRPRSDSLLWWAEQYLLLGLLRSSDSIERARIIRRFVDFMRSSIDSDNQGRWTADVTRNYQLQLEQHSDTRHSARRALHVLLNFAKWIHVATTDLEWHPMPEEIVT